MGNPTEWKKELTCGTYKDIVGSQMHYAKWETVQDKKLKAYQLIPVHDIQEKAKLQRQNKRPASCPGLRRENKEP